MEVVIAVIAVIKAVVAVIAVIAVIAKLTTYIVFFTQRLEPPNTHFYSGYEIMSTDTSLRSIDM